MRDEEKVDDEKPSCDFNSGKSERHSKDPMTALQSASNGNNFFFWIVMGKPQRLAAGGHEK